MEVLPDLRPPLSVAPEAPAPPQRASASTDHDPPNSATYTVSSGSERLVEVYPPKRRHRSSRRSSASVQSPTSSEGRSYTSASSDSWSRVEHPTYEDDVILPSDSASRSRRHSSRRHKSEVRPESTRRHSPRQVVVERDERPRRRESSRRHTSERDRPRRAESRRTPSEESSTLEGYDDYPYSHHGAPQAPPPRGYPASGYRHVRPPSHAPSHGGYPPSMSTAPPYHDPYAAQALVHMPHTDPFGYTAHNPFGPHVPRDNPFSPISPMSSADSSYFSTDPHAPSMPPHHHRPAGPPRPQSFIAPSSHYGSEIMSSYSGHSPYSAYGGPPPPPGYPPWGYGGPRSMRDDRDRQGSRDDKSSELESLKALIQKHEESRLAAEKERLAKAELDAAAAASKRAQEEAEKRKKEEIAAASKKAKEDAEKKADDDAKKAKDEHEKKLAEAKKAQEDAEKKHKELEAEAAKNKPTPDSLKAPIKFKDAVGRKFSFPWHICKTWKGMEVLIKQAFLHVEGIGEHVHAGHYDLTGPDGEIILPQVWDTMIQPDWEVTMHMWPMPEDKKEKDRLAMEAAMLADPMGHMFLGGDPMLAGGKKSSKKSKDGKKKKSSSPDPVIMVPADAPMPPPPHFPPGMAGIGMLDDRYAYADGTILYEDPKRRKSTKAAKRDPKEPSAFQTWIAGGQVRSKGKK